MTTKNILSLFAEKKPRENSGSRSANRFDYQKNWSLCELLSLHSKNDDYLMVFEHHEDIVVFDSEKSPSSAIFYQVKTKYTGNWTIASLSKVDKNGQSILKKLYTNYDYFPDFVDELVFSSNSGLSGYLANGEKALNSKTINFLQLSNKDKETVRYAVEGNSKVFCDIKGLNKITVKLAGLSLEDHTAITKGKLVEFFEREYPENTVHVALIYKTIFDEIRRKTNCEQSCTNPHELIEKKAISQSEFQSIIGIVLTGRTANELWADANQMLIAEGFKLLEIRTHRSHWQRYVVDRMNTTDESLMMLKKRVNSCLEDVESFSADLSVKDLFKVILGKVRSSKCFDWYDDQYIQAAILYEVLKDDAVSKADKEPKEEAK